MSKKFLIELLENFNSDSDYSRESFVESESDSESDYLKSIIALKNIIPANCFYLFLIFNSVENKYIFKVGSTQNIIEKMKKLNNLYLSQKKIYLIAFSELISYLFKKEFNKIKELQPFKIDKNTYNIDYKIYDIFLKSNPDGYYCISNYDDINKLIKN